MTEENTGGIISAELRWWYVEEQRRDEKQVMLPLFIALGLAAAIRSIPVDPRVTLIALPVMVGVHLLLLAFVWYGKIPRVMGGLLVGVYAAYLIAIVLA